MDTGMFTRWLPVWRIAVVMLFCVSLGSGVAAAAGGARGVPASDPRLDLASALQAMGPHPSLGDKARTFDRLVGTWDVDYLDFSKDGKAIHRSGELIIGWIMDGRAVQDLWIVYPSGARKDREVYTDLRYFDPKSGTWPATFLDPENASIARFTGGAVGEDRIVLDSQDLVATETRRWSFNDIRSDSFVFRDEASSDGGKTWSLKSEYHMKRQRESKAGQRAHPVYPRIFDFPLAMSHLPVRETLHPDSSDPAA